ncbi:MAG TPA: NifU family protein, partial [Ignavibacteriaceae bacterium]|nr:NifU family protein [Ignavibacteriaceae bacterium]
MLFVEDVDLTPNPHALKFILNRQLLKYETRQFSNKEEAETDPLAKGIFEIPGVVSVFYMNKFVTIEKTKEALWGQIQKPFQNFLKSFDESRIPAEKELMMNENAGELLTKINEIIDMRVRPALAGDGGGLQVLSLEGYTVKIRYQGACGSCPTAISSTLSAIEGLLKRDIHPALE